MQINRLFEIVYLLIEKKTITASELAGRFEVSVRTIYRDIDTLSLAGIPVYTIQGKGGGISILDQFVLNKAIISDEDQLHILSALQSVNAVEQGDIDSTLIKLGSLFKKSSTNWVEIDFSDWSGSKQELYSMVKTSILEERLLSFDYFGSNSSRSRRTVEPLRLWFKARTWYLKAFCLQKQESRLFKLSRMKQAFIHPDHFLPIHSADSIITKAAPSSITPQISVTMRIEASAAYRIYDEFDENEIHPNSDGSFLVCITCPEDNWLYGMIASFGYSAQVISPPHLREKIQQQLQQTLALYPCFPGTNA